TYSACMSSTSAEPVDSPAVIDAMPAPHVSPVHVIVIGSPSDSPRNTDRSARASMRALSVTVPDSRSYDTSSADHSYAPAPAGGSRAKAEDVKAECVSRSAATSDTPRSLSLILTNWVAMTLSNVLLGLLYLIGGRRPAGSAKPGR